MHKPIDGAGRPARQTNGSVLALRRESRGGLRAIYGRACRTDATRPTDRRPRRPLTMLSGLLVAAAASSDPSRLQQGLPPGFAALARTLFLVRSDGRRRLAWLVRAFVQCDRIG